LLQNDANVDLQLFGDFEQDGSTRQLYTVWNIAKANNEVKHFGNIPPEIIDNLLYLYTNPFDVVFDPFGGGGSSIDMCEKRKRRFYVSDLNPIPAHSDIRKHDITTGLPADMPVPDFVFLDPPYWQQAGIRIWDQITHRQLYRLTTLLPPSLWSALFRLPHIGVRVCRDNLQNLYSTPLRSE